jgi:NAD-specific glutamate dehydrogenase
MGLLTALVTLPLAPVRGTVWIAQILLEETERQMNDPAVVEQQLQEAEAAYERGELTEEEFADIEDELLGRLLSGGGN